MTDYNELLDRAIEQLPKKVEETTRFNVPNAYSMIQGNRTMIQNFTEVTDALNRDPAACFEVPFKRIRNSRKPGRNTCHTSRKVHTLLDK